MLWGHSRKILSWSGRRARTPRGREFRHGLGGRSWIRCRLQRPQTRNKMNSSTGWCLLYKREYTVSRWSGVISRNQQAFASDYQIFEDTTNSRITYRKKIFIFYRTPTTTTKKSKVKINKKKFLQRAQLKTVFTPQDSNIKWLICSLAPRRAKRGGDDGMNGTSPYHTTAELITMYI